MQPIDALANAARLKASPGKANFANYEDIFAGPAEGHVPTAHEQASGRVNSDMASTALGAGPAISALRRSMDERRFQDTNDSLAGEAEFGSGRPQKMALARAGVQNEVGDVLSEGAAERSFLPWASQARDEAQGIRSQNLNAQYVLPAQIRAQGDAAAANTTAQGRVDAAKAGRGDERMRALMNAFTAWIEKNGQVPDANTLKQMQTLAGGGQ